MPKNRAVTLMELIIVVIILGILATMGVVNYRKTTLSAFEKEAQSNLRLIQSAEEVYFLEMNTYVGCTIPGNATTSCNGVLHLSLPERNWTYAAAGNTTTFNAVAAPAAGSDAVGARSYQMGHGDVDPLLYP